MLGVLTHPDHGKGYVDLDVLSSVVKRLIDMFGSTGEGFDGVMGWEYLCDSRRSWSDFEGLDKSESDLATGEVSWVDQMGEVLKN